MATLYEIDSKLLEMIDRGFTQDCVDENGEIDEAKAQQFLSDLPVERDTKLEAYGLIIKNALAEAEAIKAEEKALASRRKAKEELAERLKQNVATSLQVFGQKKFETAKVVYTFRKSESVEIVDEAAFIEYAESTNHDDLLTYKTPTVNKTAIKAALKAGEVLTGAFIQEKQNLQIK